MSHPGGPEYRTQRRALIRRHHPDAGGDAEELRVALARLEARSIASRSDRPPVEIRRTRSGETGRLARRVTRAVRRVADSGRSLLGGRRRARYHRID